MFTLAVLGSALAGVVSVLLYNVFLHPLSRIPGPKWWSATRLPWMMSMQKGDLVHDIAAMHKKYGPAVRTAPNEISFTGIDAFEEIHGFRQDIGQFPKNPIWHEHSEPGTASIMTADKADHSRLRRITNASFATATLKKQEPLIQTYADRLVAKVRDIVRQSPKSNAVNFVDLLNFVTFDIVGELTFHESFGCLDGDRLHPWIKLTFEYFQAVSTIACVRYIPYLQNVLMFLRSSDSIKNQQWHAKQTSDAISRRTAKGGADIYTDYPDFYSFFQRAMEEKDMTVKEAEATTVNLLIGGSETIASTLAGTINYLVRYPSELKRVSDEVRAAAKDEALSMEHVMNLEYLNAVIKEGLRMTPPVPCGIPRVVPPGGAEINGYKLPAGTGVSVHHFASYRSPKLWADPNEFEPERWLADPPAKYANDNRATLKPFSLGPRRCIGERLAWVEMRLLLANLLLYFDFTPATSSGPSSADAMVHWEKQKTYMLWARQSFFVHAVEATA